MTAIEHRIEAHGEQPDYSGREFTAEEIAKGMHRRFIGGAWDTHGANQLEFLTDHGLRPEHKLLDVGCGCFRAGRYFVDYLDPGNYYGVDANLPLMQIGYDSELSDEQRGRLPIGNLRATERFDVDFGTTFDFAIAQSVFTHVSLNHIRLCLYRVATVLTSRRRAERRRAHCCRPAVIHWDRARLPRGHRSTAAIRYGLPSLTRKS